LAYSDLRVFSLLLNKPEKAFTIVDISRLSGISKVGAYWIVKGLLMQDFIVQVDNRPASYRINDRLFLDILKKR